MFKTPKAIKWPLVVDKNVERSSPYVYHRRVGVIHTNLNEQHLLRVLAARRQQTKLS